MWLDHSSIRVPAKKVRLTLQERLELLDSALRALAVDHSGRLPLQLVQDGHRLRVVPQELIVDRKANLHDVGEQLQRVRQERLAHGLARRAVARRRARQQLVYRSQVVL